MSGKQLLRFRAGPGALAKIRDEGFSPEQIGTIAGASGGAKWLVLSQIDRVVITRILPRLIGPVHLIGSSIGSWRFSCYAQEQPLATLESFEDAYLEQRYSEAPDRDEITTRSRQILQELLGDNGIREIMTNPVLRTHIMTVRSRALTASEKAPLLAAGLFAAASANLISRRTLGAFFDRGLFFDRRDLPPFFEVAGFPLHRVALTDDNYAAAVLASGAIPLVLNGVRNISGAPAGVYRDGGIIDYHLDLNTSPPDRITLFPHFYDHLVPGWFDKKLSWRRPDPRHTDRTLLICPSREFVASLPRARIPDRTDFQTMTPDERRKTWRSVLAACEALAEELNTVLDKDHLPARLESL